MNLTAKVHGGLIHPRRTSRLIELISPLVGEGSRILDVGCGDGLISASIAKRVPGAAVTGCDVLVRPSTHIPVQQFDGTHLPFETGSFDHVLLIDVVHHASDPDALLREVARVTRGTVILKDHLREGVFAGPTLRAMDWVGNSYSGVALPYNYWKQAEWESHLPAAGLRIDRWRTDLGLYPFPLNHFFDRGLHVLAQLSPAR